jgi:hypothetical protein
VIKAIIASEARQKTKKQKKKTKEQIPSKFGHFGHRA